MHTIARSCRLPNRLTTRFPESIATGMPRWRYLSRFQPDERPAIKNQDEELTHVKDVETRSIMVAVGDTQVVSPIFPAPNGAACVLAINEESADGGSGEMLKEACILYLCVSEPKLMESTAALAALMADMPHK
jgi:hypothetical protein